MSYVYYGNTRIDFEVFYAQRKTLAIEVHPNLEVKVIAPTDAQNEEIFKRIIKKGAWIVKQQDYFSSFLPRTPERAYVSGETHRYLGRLYVLKVKQGKKNRVKLKGCNLLVEVKNIDSKSVKNELTAWYLNHGNRIFKKHLEQSLNSFKRYALDKPEMEIKRMKNRWGSCTSKGKIILNPELIKAPTKCIDYVVHHELCHLIEPSHNSRFYKLQDEVFPENRYWKSRLEEAMR